jgi:hypothetical protein
LTLALFFCFTETTSITLAGTLNVNASQSTNCLNFANSDCTVKYGEQAFCQNETCYCNRDLSYVNADNKCGMFELIFGLINEIFFRIIFKLYISECTWT